MPIGSKKAAEYKVRANREGDKVKGLSLFSGIGGIDLACEWADIETVAFCEREPFPQKVLKKHWPNVPIYDDVCTLTKERLETDGIDTGTIRIIHSGYPCQPFSSAGQRKGEDDDRHLWPEVRRLLQEIDCDWWVGENVAGHITLGIDNVLADLANIGYTAQPFVLPACAVNAPHRRDRVFIIAHANRIGWNDRLDHWQERYFQNNEKRNNSESEPEWHGWLDRFGQTRKTMADTQRWDAQERELRTGQSEAESGKTSDGFSYASGYNGEWWKSEPGVGRVADGVPDRLHRLKALGNAVVPQQIYPILAAIKQIDDMIQR